MYNIISNLAAGQFRYETFEERSHIVVPVVLLAEGVHNGSGGPLFYPSDEIKRFAHSWNGMPVPVQHPEQNGKLCTCNEPKVLEKFNVGRLFHVQFSENRLKGEIWVDVQKADIVHPGLINMLKDPNAKLEVSAGLTNLRDNLEGSWNNENYIAIAKDIHPDHLALLPGKKGACSWEDGCGIRVNEDDEQDNQENKEENMSDKDTTVNENTPCETCKELVDSLISNEATKWEEADRSFLEEMDSDTLEKMVPVIPEINEDPVENEEVEETEEVVEQNDNEEKPEPSPVTVDEYIANAPVEMQEMMKEGMRSLQEKKEGLISTIMANKRNTFIKEQLIDRSTDELAQIANLAAVYTYEASAPIKTVDNEEKEELLTIPTMTFDKK